MVVRRKDLSMPLYRPPTPFRRFATNYRRDAQRDTGLRHAGRGGVSLRLESLESILAPNLFSLFAGVVPNLTAMASFGMTAVEDAATYSQTADYSDGFSPGPNGADTVDRYESPPDCNPVPDELLTPCGSGVSEVGGNLAEESVAIAPVEPSDTLPPRDQVFTNPLNLSVLNTWLPNYLTLADDLNPARDAEMESAGWLAASMNTQSSTPSVGGFDLAPDLPTGYVLPLASGAAVANAVNRMASASPTMGATQQTPIDSNAILQDVAQQGLRFETNQGQIDTRYNFVAHTPTFDVAVNSTDAALALNQAQAGAVSAALNMHLVGASGGATATGQQAFSGITNYYGGPGNTYTGIVSYAQAAFHDVYQGVDVVYHTNASTQELEYDFVVAPNADTGQVSLSFQGDQGISLDPHGDLVLSMTGGDLVQNAPVAYQEIGGVRHDVASRFMIDANQKVHFAIGDYDHAYPLTIDPTYVYSSYLGGSGTDVANAVAVNPVVQNGGERVVVVGAATSPSFRPSDTNVAALNPTLFPANGNFTNAAFAIAIDPINNNKPAYFDYFGGNRVQVAAAVAVDSQNNAYITGYTTSDQGFPVTGGGGNTLQAWQQQHGGKPAQPNLDAFALYLNPAGGITYGSYLGGAGDDAGYGIALDNNGSVFIAGATMSASFNINAVPDATFGGGMPGQTQMGFVTRLTAQGNATSLIYMGGSGGCDQLNAVVVGRSGNVYVTGITNSNDLLKGVKSGNAPFQSALGTSGGSGNGSINGNGGAGTGGGADLAAIAIVGGTGGLSGGLGGGNDGGSGSSTGTPGGGSGAGAAVPAPSPDALVANLVYNVNLAVPAVTYDTYFGGNGNDAGSGITVDPATGDAYVVGCTSSTLANGNGWGGGGANPSIIQPTVLGTSGGASDAWVAKFDATGNPNGAKRYFVYVAGTGADSATGVALIPNNGPPLLFLTGTTSSADNVIGKFPATQGAAKLQNFNVGNNNTASDAFLAQLDPSANAAKSIVSLSFIGGSGSESGAGVAVDAWANNAGNAWVVGSTASNDFPIGMVGGLQQAAGGGNMNGFVVSVKP
jgi:Beta-propeller repeat